MRISAFITFGFTVIAASVSCSGAGDAAGPTCPNSGAIPVANTAVSAPVVAPLSGCVMTDYTFPITLGGQPLINVIADSGSTTLAVAGSNCSNCTGVTPTYPVTHGSSLCEALSESYGDGTGWTAPLYQDTIQVTSSMPQIEMNFGAISSQDESNLNPGQWFFTTNTCQETVGTTYTSQGILGLGYSGLTQAPAYGFLDTIQSQLSMPDKFAVQLCMTGGNIWFGGYDPSYMTGAILYTPIDPPAGDADTFYFVTVNDMQVNGISIGQASSAYGTPIVDTGTSITQLPSAVFTAFQSALAAYPAFQSFVGSGNAANWFSNGNCVASTKTPTQVNALLPPMTMVFPASPSGTISVNMPAAQSYIFYYQDGGGNTFYCPGFSPNSSSSDPTIIGGTFLRSLITIFDRAGNQIGFAPGTGCPI